MIRKNNSGFALSFILLGVVIVIGVLVLGYFSLTKRSVQSLNTLPTPEQQRVQKLPEQIHESEDFSIMVPEGWSTANQLPGSLLTITNVGETHANDPAAQKINFKSYISVSFDKTQGKSLDKIVDDLNLQLKQTIASTKVINSQDDVIDDQKAKIVELTLTQQEVNFTIFIVVVAKADKYFVISGNTPTSKWEENKEIFENVARSFKFKY